MSSLLLDPHLFPKQGESSSNGHQATSTTDVDVIAPPLSVSDSADAPSMHTMDDQPIQQQHLGVIGVLGAKATAAMTGAVMTSLLMTPFDVLKTRLQTRPPVLLLQPSTSVSAKALGKLPESVVESCCSQTYLNNPATTATASTKTPINRIVCLSSSTATSGHPFSSTSAMTFRLDNLHSPPIGCSKPSRWAAVLSELRIPSAETSIAPKKITPGFFSELKNVWAEVGVRGLWKGVGTTLLQGIPSSAIYMIGYDHLRLQLLDLSADPQVSSTYNTVVPLLAGSLARTISATIISPMELFRTRLQALPIEGQRSPTPTSVFRELATLVKSEGVSTLYRGLGPTLWRDVPFSGIYWAGYEVVKGRFLTGPFWEAEELDGRRGSEWGRAMVAGASSGMIAALITTPFDVLKTRRQVFSPSTSLSTSASNGGHATLPLISHIIKTEGFQALFAGLAPRLAKVAPACAIMISCYEGVGSYLGGRDRAE